MYGFFLLPTIRNLSTSEYEQIAFVALALLRAIRCTGVGKRTLPILPVSWEQYLTCAAPCPPVSLVEQIVCLLMVIEWYQQAEEAGVIYGEITSEVVCPGLSPVQEKWSYWKESRKGS